ncbi:synapse-associated protein-like protein [Euroglyphus maynei]|uniref:Synapse-associated protein-like protein n=1 Tax=Euroglyphus maynei TaxID=6958 RepID=A0A1Y3AUY1_EURMA|nr:synapse-associated protein-like protein [Euroglyphus maynei]
MESIKRDLTELKDAVQNDTTNMVYSTASLVKNTFNEIGNTVTEIGSMGTNSTEDNNDNKDEMIVPDDESTKTSDDNSDKIKGLSFDMKNINSWTDKFTNTAKTTINLVKDTLVDSIFANEYSVDELNDEPYVVIDGQIVQIDGWGEHLRALQTNPNTYCREPAGPPDNFEQWLVKFNLINHQKQMEYLISNVSEISQFHDQLVPQTLSESDFWHRYFYNVQQLRERLAAEQIRVKHATNSKQQLDKNEKPPSISRSETDEWEKMNNNSSGQNSQKETEISSSKCSSDDDDRGDWI